MKKFVLMSSILLFSAVGARAQSFFPPIDWNTVNISVNQHVASENGKKCHKPAAGKTDASLPQNSQPANDSDKDKKAPVKNTQTGFLPLFFGFIG